MENCSQSIEKLISKAEIYSKTTFEICKYNTVYKSADLFSSMVVRMVLLSVFVLFSLFLNIGIALLIGEYFGELYFGFFIMAGFLSESARKNDWNNRKLYNVFEKVISKSE
jgi:hypothetical protein